MVMASSLEFVKGEELLVVGMDDRGAGMERPAELNDSTVKGNRATMESSFIVC